MKFSLSAVCIGCLVLLTLPTSGCGVSGNGLGHQGDASNGADRLSDARFGADSELGSSVAEPARDAGSGLPETNPDAGPWLPETNADALAWDAADSLHDQASPLGDVNPRPDLVAPDSLPTEDTRRGLEVQTLPDAPPPARDGGEAGEDDSNNENNDGPPQPDGPITVTLDGPVLDTALPERAPLDTASDLPVFPDLRTPDLPPPDFGPQPTSDWVVDNTTSIGGYTPTVMGRPTVTAMDAGTAVCFDGTQDGLLFDTNPIQGMQRFTLEALVFPQIPAGSQPRLIHLGDTNNNTPRLVIQMRSDAGGAWHVLVALSSGGINTNIEDTTDTHPSDQWYWLAVTYDGQTARVYVNGVLENSSNLTFSPMPAGSISLGTRQNGQYYFPGCMREVEFFGSALAASQLHKP